MEHHIIYKAVDRFAGWPANYGIWSWDDEIVVGFTVGYHKSQLDTSMHSRDKDQPFTTMQARSLDGGVHWDVQPTPCNVPGNKALSADEHVNDDLKIHNPYPLVNPPTSVSEPINFAHPDFALMCGRTGLAAGAVSWFYTSTDRCRSWQGPFHLPLFDQPGVAARTDYQISGSHDCILFLTAAKQDGHEGRVFCARTPDGGQNFEFLAWIGPEPARYSIMPASLRLTESRLLCAVRCSSTSISWIDLYASDDNGANWAYLNQPVPNTGSGGNPPAMIQLKDGRLCLVYGYRATPFGLRAKLSEDAGQTWSEDIILRDDAGNNDIGYPRICQRADGTVVAVYYTNDSPDTERYIAATLWKP